MAKTLIDLDDVALAAAQKALGTTTKVATVNEALRRAAAEDERRQALLREMARGDQYAELQDRDAMWR